MKHTVTAQAYDRRGNILASARNSYIKTHPLQALYARRAGRPGAIYLHAEISLLAKLASKRQLDEVHTVVVNRKMKSGKYGLAKPCNICQSALTDHLPLARIVWSE